MHALLDLESFPIDQPDTPNYNKIVAKCRDDLARDGMFNLEGFVRSQPVREIVSELMPVMQSHSFTHKRRHNIYFSDDITDIAANHPALKQFETINHTICADQFETSLLMSVYQ